MGNSRLPGLEGTLNLSSNSRVTSGVLPGVASARVLQQGLDLATAAFDGLTTPRAAGGIPALSPAAVNAITGVLPLILWPWGVGPPRETDVVVIPPGLSADEKEKKIREEGKKRGWSQDVIDRMVEAMKSMHGFTVPDFPPQGSKRPLRICIVVELESWRGLAKDRALAQWKLLIHEWGHAWMAWWVWWLYTHGKITYEEMYDILNQMERAYDSEGPGATDVPLPPKDGGGPEGGPGGTVRVPHTGHGVDPPYGWSPPRTGKR